AERSDERRRREMKFLHDANTGAVAVLESEVDWRRGRRGGRGTVDRVYRAVHGRGERVVRRAKAERERLQAQVVFHELLRLFLRVEIMLQPPALEPRTTIREHRDHVAGLDADIALRRL